MVTLFRPLYHQPNSSPNCKAFSKRLCLATPTEIAEHVKSLINVADRTDRTSNAKDVSVNQKRLRLNPSCLCLSQVLIIEHRWNYEKTGFDRIVSLWYPTLYARSSSLLGGIYLLDSASTITNDLGV